MCVVCVGVCGMGGVCECVCVCVWCVWFVRVLCGVCVWCVGMCECVVCVCGVCVCVVCVCV